MVEIFIVFTIMEASQLEQTNIQVIQCKKVTKKSYLGEKTFAFLLFLLIKQCQNAKGFLQIDHNTWWPFLRQRLRAN